MRISISSEELYKSLQKLSKATPARSTLPILNCVLIEVENDRVSMRTTDLEITIVCTMSASVEEPGSAAIPLQTLIEITNALTDSRLTIHADESQKIELITNNGTYDLMGKPVEEFPVTPEVDNRKATGINATVLKDIINLTSFAVSKDELKPALTGVLFRFEENRLLSVATDGHRLVRYVRNDFKSEEFSGDVIVPRKFLNLINGLMGTEEKIQIWMGDNNLTATVGGDSLFTRIIDERFPDFESVIPKDNDKELLIEREALLSTVRRVSIFSNRSTHQIALELSSDSAKVRTEDPEKASKAVEELPAKLTGEPITVGYNASYLKDVLMHLKSQNVSFHLKTPISAGLVYPEVQDVNSEITMLLMPIRLND
ncbi:MAG: DNA polymerase III subunit beta [Fidelibacterota bacterium]